MTVEAGDLLYIPQFWFAHMQLLDRDDACLLLHLPSTHKLRAHTCIPLQVCLFPHHERW